MSTFDMTGYLSIFLEEVEEQLTILDTEVLKLESDPSNQEIIQHIFRAAHTLKGSSAAMGFEQMKNVTHHLENIFENIRQQNVETSSEIVGLIFESIDAIRMLKNEIVEGNGEQMDIAALIEKLSNVGCNTEEALYKQQDNEGKSSHLLLSLDIYQQEMVQQSVDLGYGSFDIFVQIEQQCMMKSVRALVIHNALQEIGEIIAISPNMDELENDEQFAGAIQFVLLTEQSVEQVEHIIKCSIEVEKYSIKILDVSSFEQEEQRNAHETKPKAENERDFETVKIKAPTTVRVDVEKLENLMNLVGELVIDQTRLVDVRGRYSERMIPNDMEFEILDDVTNHLNRVVSELQEGMMKTRMMPIEQLFNRFPRMVRDTALKANKEIQFIVEGKETDLDRTLIEEISDPIIHLLRNAIDHGIESKEMRIQANKPEAGKVTLRATHEENHVVISIADDGRGIDIDSVKNKAVEKGFLTLEQANEMSDKDALFLIFHSGMSTAAEITEISGRGVGMDIVRSHIEKLNGLIEIESEKGIGTTFTVKLPLTLAIIRSLLVKFSNRTFAIPLTNVLEIVRLNEEEIQEINGTEVGMIRGRILPLIRMNKLMNVDEDQQVIRKKREFVVVVGIADKRVGLIADRTLGNQEIVIKSLGSYIGSPPFISGATIMGDGSVALILDVNAVVKDRSTQVFEEEQTTIMNQQNDQQLVTFKVGNEYYGVDIQQAKDIIAVSKITSVANAPKDVLGLINLREKMLPVYDLRGRLGLDRAAFTKKSRIIVIENNEKTLGLLVDEVTEVVKSTNLEIEELNVHKNIEHTQLIQGVTKLEDRVIFILALEQLLQQMNYMDTRGE